MAMPDLYRKSWHQETFADIWGDRHKTLDFIHEPFNDTLTEACWISRGFAKQKFTGDLYDMRFPEPSWIDNFRRQIPLTHFSWSVYRMSPGTVLPEHGDTYRKFREIYSVADINTIRRYVIFLEDWQSGHYFEIDRTPVVQWSKGDAICWRGDTVHIAANLGCQDRYTLQITGVSNA